jgi:hypothetical protein
VISGAADPARRSAPGGGVCRKLELTVVFTRRTIALLCADALARGGIRPRVARDGQLGYAQALSAAPSGRRC